MRRKLFSFLLSVLTLLSAIPITSVYAEEGPVTDAAIVYHDQLGRVIRRDAYTEGYTFHSNYPIFAVGPQYQNCAWSTAPDGEGTRYNDGDVLNFLETDLGVYPVLQQGNKVRFDSQGGTPIPYQFILPGGTAEEPDAPVRDGYFFDGWFNGDAEYDFSTVVTEEVTLTAHWTAAPTTYSVRIWLQQTDGSYKYHSSFTKPGITGGDAAFDPAEESTLPAVKAATYSGTSPKNFAVYFCDDQYGETALTMTNASIANVNDNGGIAADGSSAINVYFRILVYNCTLSSGEYPISGGPYSYTFPLRNGERIQSAITRNDVAINSDFYAVIQAGLYRENYMFYYDCGGSNVSGDVLASHSAQNFYSSYGVVASDYMLCKWQIKYRQKGNIVYERRIYSETIDSAIEERETDFREFSYDNFFLSYISYPYRNSNTDGYIGSPSSGYDYYFLQIVDDNGNVKVAPYAYHGEYRVIYPQPWHTDFFQVRKHFAVDFDTLTTYLSADSHTLVYGEPLSDLNGQITYTDSDGTHGFVVDETEYTDSTLKTWVFKGWYDNDAFVGSPVDFATATGTMPANPVHYYAKWELKQIDVTYDPVTGSILGQGTGETVTEAEDIGSIPEYYEPEAPEGMTFVCWTINGHYYDFTEPVANDVTLEAVYFSDASYDITYYVGEGSGTAPADSEVYAVGANAKVLAPTAEMTAPARAYFIYWEDADGNTYVPGSEIIIGTADVALTAVYGSYGTLTEDAVVVDFGIPVEIDISANDTYKESLTVNAISAAAPAGENVPAINTGFGDEAFFTETSITSGNGTFNLLNGKIVFTPTAMTFDEPIVIYYDAAVSCGSGQTGYLYSSLTVIPATVIYYEDDFVTFSGDWTEVEDTSFDSNQSIDGEIYGYDPAYTDCTEYSFGHAMKAVAEKGGSASTAEFTFTGTGFDIISLTNAETGAIFVDVYQNDEIIRKWVVDTYYGCECETTYYERTWTFGADGIWHTGKAVPSDRDAYLAGKDIRLPNEAAAGTEVTLYETGCEWVRSGSGFDTLYQIPVIKSGDELDYGTYRVVIRFVYDSFFVHEQGSTSYDFYLDAIRIYNPAKGNAEAEAVYMEDREALPTFTEIRSLLIDKFNSEEAVSGAVFIDGFGTIDEESDDGIFNFVNYGPNNEVYLAGGQAIVFTLTQDDTFDRIHVAAKRVNGSAVMNVCGTDIAIGTATDLYYDITDMIEWENGTGIVVIANTGDNILSLTNVKITHTAAPASDLLMTIDRNTAYLAYASVVKAVALKHTDVFAPKLNVILNKTAVRVGDKVNVTVTAPANVTAITVNGKAAEQGKANKKTGFVTWSVSFTVDTDSDCAVQVVAENGIGSKSRVNEVLEQNENAKNIVKAVVVTPASVLEPIFG